MVKYVLDLLGPGILKSACLKKKFMNWANFLCAGSDVMIFGKTANYALYL